MPSTKTSIEGTIFTPITYGHFYQEKVSSIFFSYTLKLNISFLYLIILCIFHAYYYEVTDRFILCSIALPLAFTP